MFNNNIDINIKFINLFSIEMEDQFNQNEEQNKSIISEEKKEYKNKNEKKDKIILSNVANIDIDKIWNNNSKYKIKYTVVLEFLKRREEQKYNNENEYWCNILLVPPDIELSNKISVLNLLALYYYKNRKKELIYNIANKIDKYSDFFNAIDPAFGINIFLKTVNSLNDKFTFLYAYKYMIKIKNIIDKNLVIIKKNYNINNINLMHEEIKVNMINHLTNYKIKYSDENYIKLEDIYKLKNIIDKLIADKYSLDNEEVSSSEEAKNNANNSKNFYLYAINKDWIIKAKFFIENFIKAKEGKLDNFYEESFCQKYVYNTYFNEKEQESGNNKNEKKGFYAFPGPVSNFEITSFKDYWTDFNNLDENDFIKKDMKLNENYFLVKENDWKLIKDIFGATNEIKRRKNNLDLVQIKFILFDKRIDTEFDNVNLLKQKYILININATIKQLKDKIINAVNENLKYIEEEKKETNKKQISFYILDKNKKQLLIEMCFSFVINNSIYDSIHIEKIDFKDENTLKDLFNKYDKGKHILIIEIFNSDEPNFFLDLKLKFNKQFKCTICEKIIENITNIYKCDICNLSLFCSKNCANQSKEHKKLDKQYIQILEQKFILSDLLSMNLEDILPDNCIHGKVGLFNMGNTCYLNSALQCLSNTEDLTKYFLNNWFKTEINNGNSLGSKGFISKEYSKFINKMWVGNDYQFCPKEFRINFCRKTQLFLNSEQQDSQEFLLAVLDNLHEDLNRITNKKYMELQEKQDEESDEQASKRWWDYYKSRENSIIVDLFQGQFKSTIKCSFCGKSSTSYETYNSLGLPIPIKGSQTQIKFLTAELNFIDINLKIDENYAIKDIIKKATSYLNKKKYIDYLNNKNNGNTKLLGDNPQDLNYKNEELEKLLYNNIEVIEFSEGFKMNNIYKTSYDNININYQGENNMKQPLFDNLKLNTLFKNNNSKEIILLEKNINLDPQKYSNIYIYPIAEIEIIGFFSSSVKKVILSYPIILTLKNDDSLEQLESSAYKKLSKILKKEDNSVLIEICFPHFTKNWGNFNNENEECPICRKKYNKEKKKFCNLFENIQKNTKISELINNRNNGRILILYAKSPKYNLESELYSGLPLFNENSRNNYKNALNIYDALDNFNKEEILDGDNMWFCNKCKEHRKAEKKIEIYRTPIYLIVQLKRFKKTNAFMKAIFGNKNETFIEYKEILNLKDFVFGPDKNKSIYSLYGVIIHKKFMNGGHYYAYCKNKGVWLTFNDENITKCKNPVDKDAYLLFYKRKTFE